MIEKVALVAGANGIIGKALMEEIARTPGWRGIALSRRPHEAGGSITCDLTDTEGTRTALAGAGEATHLAISVPTSTRRRKTNCSAVPPLAVPLGRSCGQTSWSGTPPAMR